MSADTMRLVTLTAKVDSSVYETWVALRKRYCQLIHGQVFDTFSDELAVGVILESVMEERIREMADELAKGGAK
jgi:hypothetical protein